MAVRSLFCMRTGGGGAYLNMGPNMREIPLCPLHSEYDIVCQVGVGFWWAQGLAVHVERVALHQHLERVVTVCVWLALKS